MPPAWQNAHTLTTGQAIFVTIFGKKSPQLSANNHDRNSLFPRLQIDEKMQEKLSKKENF